MREIPGPTARLLLADRPMRLLDVTIPTLLAAVLAITGCGSTADPTTGTDGPQTYGGAITPSTPNSQGDNGDNTDGPLVAVDDSVPTTHVGTDLVVNGTMQTTGNVNLRKGPGTSYAVLEVIPSGSDVTLLSTTPSNGFLNVEFNGTAGWVSATYLVAVTTSPGPGTGPVDVEGAASPDNALARAMLAVGYSYYWGGGAWLDSGVSASSAGSCSGSCPSCSHSGKYGADCSGLVAKAWQLGVKALAVDSHPYSTVSFNGTSSEWSDVSRSSLKKGDALVYNSGGSGHIVLYEKGDGWGTPTVVECRGCAYGCVYNARSFTSAFKGVRRTGF